MNENRDNEDNSEKEFPTHWLETILAEIRGRKVNQVPVLRPHGRSEG